jgi:hypothetical protein
MDDKPELDREAEAPWNGSANAVSHVFAMASGVLIPNFRSDMRHESVKVMLP